MQREAVTPLDEVNELRNDSILLSIYCMPDIVLSTAPSEAGFTSITEAICGGPTGCCTGSQDLNSDLSDPRLPPQHTNAGATSQGTLGQSFRPVHSTSHHSRLGQGRDSIHTT